MCSITIILYVGKREGERERGRENECAYKTLRLREGYRTKWMCKMMENSTRTREEGRIEGQKQQQQQFIRCLVLLLAPFMIIANGEQAHHHWKGQAASFDLFGEAIVFVVVVVVVVVWCYPTFQLVWLCVLSRQPRIQTQRCTTFCQFLSVCDFFFHSCVCRAEW